MKNRKRDIDVQNRLLDPVGESKGVMFRENSIETSILTRVKKITNPGWMHETSAQGWCTGKTQRDGMEREAGGRIGMGKHVNPWLIHVNVWQKPLQYCNVISFQLIKINRKKIKKKKKKRQRNQRSNCQYPLDHRKSKRVQKKTSISALLTMPKPLTVWTTINCGKFQKRWEYQTT